MYDLLIGPSDFAVILLSVVSDTKISDEMSQLGEFLKTLKGSDTSAQELYERVQWNPRIIPRL